jgi:hypothetical protein
MDPETVIVFNGYPNPHLKKLHNVHSYFNFFWHCLVEDSAQNYKCEHQATVSSFHPEGGNSQSVKNRKEDQLLLVSPAHDFDLYSGSADRNHTISYLWPVTKVFQLEIHWAEVQSGLWGWVNYILQEKNFLLCSVWLEMYTNLTLALL